MTSPLSDIEIVDRPGGVELHVKVVPGASRTGVAGRWGSALKVAVSAPAEGGRANHALVQLLAELLAVRPADVKVVAGRTRPLKRVAVNGVTAATARHRLG